MKTLVLRGRIKDELEELEQVVSRVIQAWVAAEKEQDNSLFFLDSVALNLHSFYSGIEKILMLIVFNIDETEPAGERWHRELLRQMSTEVPGLRPAVITRFMKEKLYEYLSFRHVIRNIYAFNLDAEKLDRLVSDLPEVFNKFKTEMSVFNKYLEELED